MNATKETSRPLGNGADEQELTMLQTMNNQKLMGAKEALKQKLLRTLLQQALEEMGEPDAMALEAMHQIGPQQTLLDSASQRLREIILAEVAQRSTETFHEAEQVAAQAQAFVQKDNVAVIGASSVLRELLLEEIARRAMTTLQDPGMVARQAKGRVDITHEVLAEARQALEGLFLEEVVARTLEGMTDAQALAEQAKSQIGEQPVVVLEATDQLTQVLIRDIAARSIHDLADTEGAAQKAREQVDSNHESFIRASRKLYDQLIGEVAHYATLALQDVELAVKQAKGRVPADHKHLVEASNALQQLLIDEVAARATAAMDDAGAIAHQAKAQVDPAHAALTAAASVLRELLLGEVARQAAASITDAEATAQEARQALPAEEPAVTQASETLRHLLLHEVVRRTLDTLHDRQQVATEARAQVEVDGEVFARASSVLRDMLISEIASRTTETFQDTGSVARQAKGRIADDHPVVGQASGLLRELLIDDVIQFATQALEDAESAAQEALIRVDSGHEVIVKARRVLKERMLQSMLNEAIREINDSVGEGYGEPASFFFQQAVAAASQAAGRNGQSPATPAVPQQLPDADAEAPVPAAETPAFDEHTEQSTEAAEADPRIFDEEPLLVVSDAYFAPDEPAPDEPVAAGPDDFAGVADAVEEVASSWTRLSEIEAHYDADRAFEIDQEEAVDPVTATEQDLVVDEVVALPEAANEAAFAQEQDDTFGFTEAEEADFFDDAEETPAPEETFAEADYPGPEADYPGPEADADLAEATHATPPVFFTAATLESAASDSPNFFKPMMLFGEEVPEADGPQEPGGQAAAWADPETEQPDLPVVLPESNPAHTQPVESTGFYLYGIMSVQGAEALSELPAHGIDQAHPIFLVKFQELMAIASRVALEHFGEQAMRNNIKNTQWLRERVRAHASIMEQFKVTGTLIPMRFGTVLNDEQGIRDLLNDRYHQYIEMLNQLDGRQEWGLRMYLDRAQLSGRVSQSDRQIEDSLDQISKGVARFVRDEMTKMDNLDEGELVELLTENCIKRSHDALLKYAENGLFKPLKSQAVYGPGEMILNAAYLVPVEREAGFREEVEQITATYSPMGFTFELTGPWPPYHFVDQHGDAQYNALSAV